MKRTGGEGELTARGTSSGWKFNRDLFDGLAQKGVCVVCVCVCGWVWACVLYVAGSSTGACLMAWPRKVCACVVCVCVWVGVCVGVLYLAGSPIGTCLTAWPRKVCVCVCVCVCGWVCRCVFFIELEVQ